MTKIEYVWLDGCTTKKLRSKTKVLTTEETAIPIHLTDIPVWSFDGSSTNQASGSDSDCILKPVRLYENPFKGESGYIVLCEVWTSDESPHETNSRYTLEETCSNVSVSDAEPWFGIEQEYTMFKDGRPLGWPETGEPTEQGDYYCGRNVGENLVREHLNACINAGVKIAGINSEVMLGQWEYQIGTSDPLRVSDDIWMARWILEKICDEENVTVSLDPKPVKGDWNGAGAHTNFSTKAMRDKDSGSVAIQETIYELSLRHDDHMRVYGVGNIRRLTGSHETCSINRFHSGVADRGASVRIPRQVATDGCGYIEDRRPAANADPYEVCNSILSTVLS
ncbi:glutamine synthetase beta-grasp domain-containing protein [bacterium]|nr:glutamine synthetase beta-grasp domain-containing protein [bacterium]